MRCLYIVQACLREEEWGDAELEFYLVIREELEQFVAGNRRAAGGTVKGLTTPLTSPGRFLGQLRNFVTRFVSNLKISQMLPICHAFSLEPEPRERRWLVEGLWAEQAVGIIGGEPKCCKSFMALSLGVAVASGRPCLGRFAVPEPGRVLLYPAEDALATV